MTQQVQTKTYLQVAEAMLNEIKKPGAWCQEFLTDSKGAHCLRGHFFAQVGVELKCDGRRIGIDTVFNHHPHMRFKENNFFTALGFDEILPSSGREIGERVADFNNDNTYESVVDMMQRGIEHLKLTEQVNLPL
jgi:hypothetical protein